MQTQAYISWLSDVSTHPYASRGVQQVSNCLGSLLHMVGEEFLELEIMTRWLRSSKIRETTA